MLEIVIYWAVGRGMCIMIVDSGGHFNSHCEGEGIIGRREIFFKIYVGFL